jgi:ABC-type Fe3+ transport system permease subunit
MRCQPRRSIALERHNIICDYFRGHETRTANCRKNALIRTLIRSFSLVCFAAAIVAAVLDATRSIADSRLVTTSLAADWNHVSPRSLENLESWTIETLHPYLWDPILVNLLAAPTWAVFTVLALLFAFLARRRRRRWQEMFEA